MYSRDVTVSVVTAVYNGGSHLLPFLENLRGQYFDGVEFVIVDDGSTDGTAEMLSRLRPPFRVLSRRTNVGLTASLREGVAEAKGEFVARQDVDDRARHDRLQVQSRYMLAEPEAVLSAASYRKVAWDGSFCRVCHAPPTESALRWRMLFQNPIIHSAAMFRRSAYLRVGGYDPQGFRVTQDYDLWQRLAKAGRILPVHPVLIDLAVGSPQSISGRNRDAQAESIEKVSTRDLSRVLGHSLSAEQVAKYRDIWHGGSSGDGHIESRMMNELAHKFLTTTRWADRHGTAAVIAEMAMRYSRVSRRLVINLLRVAMGISMSGTLRAVMNGRFIAEMALGPGRISGKGR